MDADSTVSNARLERANRGLHEAVLGRFPGNIGPQSPILDVGCGTGAWVERLTRNGYTNLTAIDYDVEQSRGIKAHVEKVDLNQADWAPLSGRFALITCIEVIEHIENIGNFLDQLRAHLAEGGSILMTTPNTECLAARLRFLLLNQLKQFDTLGDATHVMPMFTLTLDRLVARHGLRVVTRWGYPANHRTLTSRWWVNAICAIVRPFLPEPIGGDNVCLQLVAV
jgi:2-polyprenyl-3-methyl-5-hydroxy-6-metoxy-1,4-benzoquinol methylase